eukprot:409944-Amphidinium_carterae.1
MSRVLSPRGGKKAACSASQGQWVRCCSLFLVHAPSRSRISQGSLDRLVTANSTVQCCGADAGALSHAKRPGTLRLSVTIDLYKQAWPCFELVFQDLVLGFIIQAVTQ